MIENSKFNPPSPTMRNSFDISLKSFIKRVFKKKLLKLKR
jgi:hypothetical protein